jgi:hypothetical protein
MGKNRGWDRVRFAGAGWTRVRIPYLVIIGIALGACHSPLSSREVLALADAEERWAARPFADYTFETSASCFCDPEISQWARVEVSGGAVTRVVLLASGQDVALDRRRYFRTVESLFDLIRQAQDSRAVKDISAEYDPQFGYPTFIRLAAPDNVTDGGSEHFARNLAPLP